MPGFGLPSSFSRSAYLALLTLLALGLAPGYGQTPAHSDESDAQAIKDLIAKYAAAVSVEPVDIDLASQVWLNSPDVSFINPVGHEHGWEEIKRNFYEKIMEGLFSERKLAVRDISLHVYGDSAWAEFYWHFTAKFRSNNSTVETNGTETQIYREIGAGRWALVHVHYSEMPFAPNRTLPSTQ